MRRPRLVVPLAFLVLLVLLAGCVAQAPSAPVVEPASREDGASDLRTRMGCLQAHHTFPSAAEGFRAFVPQGFELVTEDPAGLVVNVRVEATVCSDASEVWVELPASPPAHLAHASGMEIHTLPVVAYASPELAAWHATRLPDRVFVAEISLAASPASEYTLTATTGTERYLWEGALDPGGDAFAEQAVARWLQDASKKDGVSGHLQRFGSVSTNVGLGGVAMVYQGDGGAPPVSNGVVHVVSGLTLTETFVVNA